MVANLMRYNSIGEYFYRLSNRCLGLVLFPVIVVWGAYMVERYFFSDLFSPQSEEKAVYGSLVGLGAVVSFLFFLQREWAKRKLKKLILEPSLGARIRDYVPVALFRFRCFCLMLLLIGLPVFFTMRFEYTYILPIPIFSIALYWPVRWRISKDLKLKREEREILNDKALGV